MVKNAITVFARVKPEASRKGLVNYKIHRRPKKHSNEDFLVLTAPQKFAEYIDNRPESWNFSFSRIFGHDVPQDDVFDSVARPVVNRVFDGYNATIFAYGQTGSGKTYTITGEPGVHSERGILPRTLQYVFDMVRKNPENLYSVEVAYLEIYNENGYDLLLERKQREAAGRLEDLPRVTIQEDESGTMHLKNLSFRTVENEKEALQYLVDGDVYRAVSETPMNPRSSRSHCIFTIVVSVKKIGEDRYSRAKMHLVDLAGSERVYKCSIQGTILTEAKHINLSLHFLEQVIVCLGQDNVSHVPYRNSLLTSILRDSLGGNCLTTMLATLSVSTFNLEETISTCRFAQRVALVKNDVNLTFELDTKSENMLLRMENDRLRKQIEELKKQALVSSSCTSSAGSLEYYKNLVVQRDQEISRLIDILKKERGRQKPAIKEAPYRDVPEVGHDQRSTQVPSSRVSPRTVYRTSPTMLKKRRHGNSLQGKAKMTPQRDESVSPKTTQKIQPLKRSPRSMVTEVPDLDLKEDVDGINDGVIQDSQDDWNVSNIDTKTGRRETGALEKNRKQGIQTFNIDELKIILDKKSKKLPDDCTNSNITSHNDIENERRGTVVSERNRRQDTQTLVEDLRIKDNQKSKKLPDDYINSNITSHNDIENERRGTVVSERNRRQDTQTLVEDLRVKDNQNSKKLTDVKIDSDIAYLDTKNRRREGVVSERSKRQITQTLNIEDLQIRDNQKSQKLADARFDLTIACHTDGKSDSRDTVLSENQRRENAQTRNIKDSRIVDNQKSRKLLDDEIDSNRAHHINTGNDRRETVVSNRHTRRDTQTLNIEDSLINHNQKSKTLPDAQIDSDVAYRDTKNVKIETVVLQKLSRQNTQTLNIEDLPINRNQKSKKLPDPEIEANIAHHIDSQVRKTDTIVSGSHRQQNTQTLNIKESCVNDNQGSKNLADSQSNSYIAYDNSTKTDRNESVVSENPRQQNNQKTGIDELTTNQNKRSKQHPAVSMDATIAPNIDTKTEERETVESERHRLKNTQTLKTEESTTNDNESKIKKSVDLQFSLANANVFSRELSSAAKNTQKPGQASDADEAEPNVVPKSDKIPMNEKSPREKSPGFPRNVMNMIRTSRNRHNEDNEETSSPKSRTPSSGFKAPSIIRNMLCREKSSPRESPTRIEDKKPNPSSVNQDDPKISGTFKKSLPLTGDPEIDEEIIAFYKAKRSGGVY